METKETKVTNRIEIIKPRSYVACLAEGLKFPLLHFMELARMLFPVVLIYALAYVFIIRWISPLLMLKVRGCMDSFFMATNFLGRVRPIVLFMAYLLLMQLPSLLVTGIIIYQQRYATVHGVLPRRWDEGKAIMHSVLRAVAAGFILTVGLMLVTALYVVLMYFMPHKVAPGNVPMLLGMMMLLGWIVILVATAFFLHFYMEYVYSDTSFLNSLKAMNRGFMYIGRTLAILLISGLLTLIVMIVLTLPAFVVSFVDATANATILMGDTVDLPSYWVFLSPSINVICSVFTWMATLFVMWIFLFHWGSITAIEQLRQQESEKTEG